jgi:hypothetical protein
MPFWSQRHIGETYSSEKQGLTGISVAHEMLDLSRV